MNLAISTDGRNFETPKFLRKQAITALEHAKAIEKQRLAYGAKYVQIDARTRALKRA